MDASFRAALWHQFGASIDMLENAIVLCPDELWDDDKQFWYSAYHCLFWLDYYLTLEPGSYVPPPPFTLSEFDPSGAKPDRAYSKAEVLAFLHHGRRKCRDLIAGMTDEIANQRWINEYKNYSVLEILLYNMRHVQHHAAQLNLVLRQTIDQVPNWVAQTKENL
jgi:DinB superfamily